MELLVYTIYYFSLFQPQLHQKRIYSQKNRVWSFFLKVLNWKGDCGHGWKKTKYYKFEVK